MTKTRKPKVKETSERVGRNPKNGVEDVIPGKKRVQFKAGKNLKRMLNGEKEFLARSDVTPPMRHHTS